MTIMTVVFVYFFNRRVWVVSYQRIWHQLWFCHSKKKAWLSFGIVAVTSCILSLMALMS